MAISKIIQKLVSEKIVTITDSELEELISQSEIVEEKKIVMLGFIRIVVYDTHVAESVDEAKKFVRDRLDTYDRMWDGCGCKIDYFT